MVRDLQFFFWTRWSLHHCAFGEEAALAEDTFPIRIYHNGIPDDVRTQKTFGALTVNRSIHARLVDGPGPAIRSTAQKHCLCEGSR